MVTCHHCGTEFDITETLQKIEETLKRLDEEETP